MNTPTVTLGIALALFVDLSWAESPKHPAPGLTDKLSLATAQEYYDRGQLEESRAQLRSLAKRTPLSADGLILAGNLLRRNGDWVSAEGAYRAALAQAPARADLHLLLGQALHAQGKFQAADAQFARYVQLSQGSTP